MAKLVGVYDEEDEIQLGRRQLPLSVYDNKIMTMQLGEGCDGCGITGGTTKRRCDESFSRQYNKLSKEDVEAALMVPSKTLFIRLAQTVGCVGCRRSVERLFNQLKDSGHPALEPLAVTNNGVLTVLRKYALQARSLGALFSDHGLALSVVLDNIPKLKKSGRCVLHSMEGIRCRPGGRSWRDVWEVMDSSCRETVTLISSDHLLSTLDNYLRKHRFCQECKNKVHRAFDILVGHTTIDPAKEKGYVASLYSGIRRCEAKRHIHVPADSDYVSHIITRAEPELQGRRERHAKTLEIAQEEVLTCLGLFLYERLQRIHTRMREEEQTWDILFHVALDALKKSFEVAVEEKQGYSKFELLCEELQRQELKEKAKKEKKKKKKKNKKNDEGKENNCLCDDEEGCRECEFNMSSQSSCSNQRSSLINTTNKQVRNDMFCRGSSHLGPPLGNSHNPLEQPEEITRCSSHCGSMEASDIGSERGSSEEKESCCPGPYRENEHHHHRCSRNSPHPLECTASTDSLVSRCSQGSRDGGYCSAHGSGGSSRDSSEVACGEGLCSHYHDDHVDYSIQNEHHHNHMEDEAIDHLHPPLSPSPSRPYQPFTLSLQQMLEDSRCEDEEIPEAEVRAWRARLGIVKQKRAELRQTLRQRFQQFCHRGCGEASMTSINGSAHICHHHAHSPHGALPAHHISVMKPC
ncbi:gametogenetin-binding protein 2-like isoform X1 [Palaemon carinicauda]|uniref:gametogenetin-binding protein 2-like isoform X1 n=1 Tax=Palaemon carinicauda TaxID=392227 RepID=UPI0035B5CB68